MLTVFLFTYIATILLFYITFIVGIFTDNRNYKISAIIVSAVPLELTAMLLTGTLTFLALLFTVF